MKFEIPIWAPNHTTVHTPENRCLVGGRVSGPNYSKFGMYVEPLSMLLKFKTGEDILLGFQTTAAQTSSVVRYKAKIFVLFDLL